MWTTTYVFSSDMVLQIKMYGCASIIVFVDHYVQQTRDLTFPKNESKL